MELQLFRTYHAEGTNGELWCEGRMLCFTIELPWRHNQRSVSCIPEGRYRLRKRFTKRHQHHLQVADVPDRSGILLHPANDAAKELLGCIAPVAALTGHGCGIHSRLANEKLKAVVVAAMDDGDEVYINIKSKQHEHYTTDAGADA